MKFVSQTVVSLMLVAVTASAQPKAKPAAGLALAQAQSLHLSALNQAKAGDLKGALRALQSLSMQKFAPVEKDRVFMTMGRLNYEIGNFDQAIAAYSQIRQTSPSWLEALEEQAWAQFREGHPEATVAKLKTVTSVAFKDSTKSEPFFLLGLAQLRVCDFKGVFATIDLFKKRFSEKTKAIESSRAPQDLATVKEIGETVQKLNLVEAETIQRLYVDDNGKKQKGSTPSIARDGDQLSFPTTNDDEFWLDEVDGYKVALKGCVAPKASKKLASSSKNEVIK